MMHQRLEILLQYFREEPNDPFHAYALALEYVKFDRENARKFFDILETKHPDYLPAYYHAAKFFQESNDRERVIALYEKGIELAKLKKDAKALRELQSAYDEFVYE